MHSFNDVKNAYENCNPKVTARFGRDLNLRPISPSHHSRFYEHIFKFSNTCYGLFCGGIGDPLFDRHLPDGSFAPWPSSKAPYKERLAHISDYEAKRFAPILWEKKGTYERVTVRHAAALRNPWSHYKFLRQNLPNGLSFPYSKNGKQYVKITANAGAIFLAKDEYAPEHFVSHVSNRRGDVFPYRIYRKGARDLGSLVFTRKIDSQQPWRHSKTSGKPEHKTLYRVDKEEKARLRPHLDELREQAAAFYPMYTNNRTVNEIYSDVRASFNEAKAGYPDIRNVWNMHAKKLAPMYREALVDPSHTARLVLIKLFCYAVMVDHNYRKEEVTKASFNESTNLLMNEMFGLVKKVEVPLE